MISWQIQESISAFKKSFFQTSTRLLFSLVEFFSTHFLCKLCIWKTILRVQGIFEYKSEHRTTRRNNSTTGERELSKFRKWSMLIRRIFYESFKNLPCEATSRVSKNFSRRQIKNSFLTKVAECSEDEKRYIQHGHMTNIGL